MAANDRMRLAKRGREARGARDCRRAARRRGYRAAKRTTIAHKMQQFSRWRQSSLANVDDGRGCSHVMELQFPIF